MGWLWGYSRNPWVDYIVISIPLWDDCEENDYYFISQWLYYFNSTMGWLWDQRLFILKTTKQISIPLWDDCEKSDSFQLSPLISISIPLWDDCEIPWKKLSSCFNNFNSTMGWLWAIYLSWRIYSIVFQFHYGMIVSLPPHRIFTNI